MLPCAQLVGFAVDVFAQKWSCECVTGLRLRIAIPVTFTRIKKRGLSLEILKSSLIPSNDELNKHHAYNALKRRIITILQCFPMRLLRHNHA